MQKPNRGRRWRTRCASSCLCLWVNVFSLAFKCSVRSRFSLDFSALVVLNPTLKCQVPPCIADIRLWNLNSLPGIRSLEEKCHCSFFMEPCVFYWTYLIPSVQAECRDNMLPHVLQWSCCGNCHQGYSGVTLVQLKVGDNTVTVAGQNLSFVALLPAIKICCCKRNSAPKWSQRGGNAAAKNGSAADGVEHDSKWCYFLRGNFKPSLCSPMYMANPTKLD